MLRILLIVNGMSAVAALLKAATFQADVAGIDGAFGAGAAAAAAFSLLVLCARAHVCWRACLTVLA